jgi:hypothetical protein
VATGSAVLHPKALAITSSIAKLGLVRGNVDIAEPAATNVGGWF